MYEERKEGVRRQIRPGNAKSLWESVKIAKDEFISDVPNEMYLNNTKFKGDNAKQSF